MAFSGLEIAWGDDWNLTGRPLMMKFSAETSSGRPCCGRVSIVSTSIFVTEASLDGQVLRFLY